MHQWKSCHVNNVQARAATFLVLAWHHWRDRALSMPGSRASRGPNHKDIKRASISKKTANLPNVNCHLTLPEPPTPRQQRPVRLLLQVGGWRGNFIKGSPVTKAPALLSTSRWKQKGMKTGTTLCSNESWRRNEDESRPTAEKLKKNRECFCFV